MLVHLLLAAIWTMPLVQVSGQHGGGSAASSVVSAKESTVWGSGIHANVDVPARYVHIQLRDEQGTPLSGASATSFQKGRIKVSVIHYALQTGAATTPRIKLLNHGDGVISAQYYFNVQPSKIKVKIMLDGKHVAASPYILEGPLPTEACHCPRSQDQFFQDYQCAGSDMSGQIHEDMTRNFPNGITREEFDAGLERVSVNASALVHFTVVNNIIYSKNMGKYGGFQKNINEILTSLQKKVVLPDVEFLFNMGDWPQSPKKGGYNGAPEDLPPAPIFSWCGSSTHYDMVVPTYKMVSATVFGKDLENVQEVDGTSFEVGGPWAKKREAVYFRGRPSSDVRTAVSVAAKQNPEMDVRISRNHFNYFPSEAAKAEHVEYEKTYGPKVKRDAFQAAFKNKYQLNLDGTVAAYRMPALIAGNAVVLKQESDYYEHFYKALAPFKHYIPLNRDASNLEEMLQWAKDNDKEAEQIGRRARLYARHHLRVEDVYCYHLMALQRFAALQKFSPKVHRGMSRVEAAAKTNEQDVQCSCPARKGEPAAARDRPSMWARAADTLKSAFVQQPKTEL